MRTISEMELRRRLGNILRAVERGEEFTITHDGEPIARLMPAAATAHVEHAHRVRVRPKRVAQQGWEAPDDVGELLQQMKVRRQELYEAMKSAKSARDPDPA